MNAQIIRRAAAVAAAAMITASAPVAAKSVDSRPTQAKEGTAAAPAVGKPKKYCITDTLTGSRMAKKICRTEAEWARGGVDVSGK